MCLKLANVLQQIDALNFIDFLHEVTTLILKVGRVISTRFLLHLFGGDKRPK